MQEGVCGLREPLVGTIILVQMMTKMLKVKQNLGSLFLQRQKDAPTRQAGALGSGNQATSVNKRHS